MPIWQELSWPRIKECAEKGLVVIIPIGVIEQHGHHLPLDTDAFFAQEMARAAARRAPEILVGPTVAVRLHAQQQELSRQHQPHRRHMGRR